MTKEDCEQIEEIKQEGGTLFFIECKETNKWFSFNWGNISWTRDPMKAQGFLTRKEAEETAKGYFCFHEFSKMIITEHEFISKNKHLKINIKLLFNTSTIICIF